jgi:hypothetical protein
VDYRYVETTLFGKAEGCNFILKGCKDTKVYSEFCSNSQVGSNMINFERLAYGKCSLNSGDFNDCPMV